MSKKKLRFVIPNFLGEDCLYQIAPALPYLAFLVLRCIFVYPLARREGAERNGGSVGGREGAVCCLFSRFSTALMSSKYRSGGGLDTNEGNMKH